MFSSCATAAHRQNIITTRSVSNSRLDTLQAAILRAKLTHLEEWNAARRRIAAHYDEALRAISEVHCTPDTLGSVHHLYVIRLDGRDNVLQALNARGVAPGSAIHSPCTSSKPTPRSDIGRGLSRSPTTGRARCLSLPIYPSSLRRKSISGRRRFEAALQARARGQRLGRLTMSSPADIFVHRLALRESDEVGAGTQIWAFATS